jgi:tetratricopeptide (TPR) repeat protein
LSRGLAFEAKGDHDHAIFDYDRVIRLGPKNSYAFYDRSNAWQAKGDTARAKISTKQSDWDIKRMETERRCRAKLKRH